MVDFEKVDFMIEIIEKGLVPEGKSFNEFAIEFYLETRTITLSKYLRLRGRATKLPKLMNTKKAGELLFETEKDSEVLTFLSRKGYKEIPQLNYTAVMLLRKLDLFSNWQRLLVFFEGGKTIQEINSSLKRELLPMEIEKLEKFVKDELKINDKELNFLLDKIGKIEKNKTLYKSVKKLIR